MAECPASELIAEACENGFVCLDPRLSRAVELQLWKEAAGDENTLGQLIQQACENGFICLDKRIGDAVEMQLLCNLIEE